MWNGQAIQFEFVFLNFRTQIYMVSISNLPTNYTLWGNAVLGAVRQCPAGLANPLDLLDGSQWTFRTFPGYFNTRGPSIGNLKFAEVKNQAGVLAGVVNLTETIKTFFSNGPLARLSTDQGRYSINFDCSGGTLYINNSYGPVQYEFVFSNDKFSEIYMIGIAGDVALVGTARRL